MNTNLKKEILELRCLDSKSAVTWLIDRYPVDKPKCGNAFDLASHISLKREDQIRFARYYFKVLPFLSSKFYEEFYSFMSLKNIFMIMRENLPTSYRDVDLLIYYIRPPFLVNAHNEKDRRLAEDFIVELEQIKVSLINSGE